jgi:O-antigen/teichoic acid export membrane protein
MWLIILAFAAAIATPIWYSMAEDDKYLLRLLCLILWGATIMVFVDHVMGYLMEGGEFLELRLDATVLGFAMLTAALVIWEIILILKDPKKVLYKRKSE